MGKIRYPYIFLAFLAVLWAALLFVPSVFATSSGCAADDRFAYATDRYEKGDFTAAAFGFDQFLFFHPKDARVDTAKLRLGLCRVQAGETEQAKDLFEAVSRTGAPPSDALAVLLLSRLSVREESLDEARMWLDNLLRFYSQDDIKEMALWQGGWLSLRQGALDRATSYWRHLPEPSLTEAKAAYKAWEDRPVSGRKSPGIAAVMGVVPGGGYLYTGRKQAAATAFVLNVGLGVAAFQCFEEDLPVLGGLLSLVTVGFYGGSLKGGIAAAHATNRRLDSAYEAGIEKKYGQVRSIRTPGAEFSISIPF